MTPAPTTTAPTTTTTPPALPHHFSLSALQSFSPSTAPSWQTSRPPMTTA
ncbi:MAG: hypothetical protein LBM04_01430 [Opitutaceae bacterium]|nr:hypothetical protein [Opitutaceae bacterium]